MAPSSPSPSGGLDLRLILEVPLRQFVLWLVAVLLVTWAGYPGVVCVTPVAWLLALRVGLLCAGQSHSTQPSRRLQEAALAGAWLGLLQGLLFWVYIPRMGPIRPSEQASAVMLVAGMLIVGVLAGAGLAAFNAWLFEQRRRAAQEKV